MDAQPRESRASVDQTSLSEITRERDLALTCLCATYVVAGLLLAPAGQALPWSALGTMAALPVLAAGVTRLDGQAQAPWSRVVRASWPVFAAPAAYMAEVEILELQRGRYMDGLLAYADAALGLYQGGQPLWSTGGLLEEIANVAYASYYLIPLVVIAVAVRQGPAEGARLTAALTLASLMCGMIWLVFPSGGYYLGGSPQGEAYGPFSALVHGLYAQHPHYAAAFPSEHVAHAVALAGVLAQGRRRSWVWAWALAIALSTVIGQYHYALDGVAGWAVGGAAAVWVRRPRPVALAQAWPFRARAA